VEIGGEAKGVRDGVVLGWWLVAHRESLFGFLLSVQRRWHRQWAHGGVFYVLSSGMMPLIHWGAQVAKGYTICHRWGCLGGKEGSEGIVCKAAVVMSPYTVQSQVLSEIHKRHTLVCITTDCAWQ